MKRIVTMMFAFALISLPLTAGTIAVSGGGTYSDDRSSFGLTSVWAVSFSGSNETSNVSLNFSPISGGGGGDALSEYIYATTIQTGYYPGDVGATIDSVYYRNGFYSFDLEGGGGSVSGYNSLGQVVVTESLTGDIAVTSESCSVTQFDQICSGTFTITTPAITTPEPGGLPLTVSGFALLVVLVFSRRNRLLRASA